MTFFVVVAFKKKVSVSKYSDGLHANTASSVCVVRSPAKGNNNNKSAQPIADRFFKNLHKKSLRTYFANLDCKGELAQV